MTYKLAIWVIYEKPWDYPNYFVVRAQYPQTEECIICGPAILADTLEEARAKIPSGLFRLTRHPEDVGSIVETWI